MKFAWIAEPPFNYRENGRVTGCDVELARRVAAALGEPFDPIETEFHNLLNGLEDGRWDVTTGMFATPERAIRAHFTRRIWALRDGLLVRAENVSVIGGYRSLAQIDGKLAVLEGQVQHQTATQLGIDPNDIVVLRDYGDAAAAVMDGRVIAYASVERAHRQHIAEYPDSGFACVTVPVDEKAAMPGAFACGDVMLRDRIDAVLDRFLGTADHLSMMRSFGFEAEDIQIGS